MTTRIWKYPIAVAAESILNLPKGFTVLSLTDESDLNDASLYVLVNDNNPTMPIKLYVVGTGFALDDTILSKSKFIGTVLSRHGALVWHIFIEVLK